MPALPIDEAGQYVAAAYVVFLLLILIYVAIMGSKIARIQQEVRELLDLTEEPESGAGGAAQPARSSEAGGRARTSEGGAGSPAEVIARGAEAPPTP